GRKSLARRRDELRGHVDAEIVDVGPALAAELEHDAGAAAHVEHRGHPLEQLERPEAGRVLAPFVAHAEKVLDLRGREVSPRLFDPHRALRRARLALIPAAPSAKI